jgi:hypothetical protein
VKKVSEKQRGATDRSDEPYPCLDSSFRMVGRLKDSFMWMWLTACLLDSLEENKMVEVL